VPVDVSRLLVSPTRLSTDQAKSSLTSTTELPSITSTVDVPELVPAVPPLLMPEPLLTNTSLAPDEKLFDVAAPSAAMMSLVVTRILLTPVLLPLVELFEPEDTVRADVLPETFDRVPAVVFVAELFVEEFEADNVLVPDSALPEAFALVELLVVLKPADDDGVTLALALVSTVVLFAELTLLLLLFDADAVVFAFAEPVVPAPLLPELVEFVLLSNNVRLKLIVCNCDAVAACDRASPVTSNAAAIAVHFSRCVVFICRCRFK